MNTFNKGQIFTEVYPPEAAIWCNDNNCYIIEIEPKNGVRQFQIQEVPSVSLDEVKSTKIESLKKQRSELEEAPVEYKEKLWDFDSKSRDRINAAIMALEVSDIESITWTSYDDTSAELTIIDLKTIIAIAALRGDEIHKKYRELRDAVNAATTEEEVNNISY